MYRNKPCIDIPCIYYGYTMDTLTGWDILAIYQIYTNSGKNLIGIN